MRIELDKGGKALIFTDARDRERVIPCRMADHEAASYRKAIKRTLDEMKDYLRGDDPSVMDATTALDRLNTRGLSLLVEIFGARRNDVSEMFQELFPAWRNQEEPAIITVAAALGRLVPLEFLPLFDLADWPMIADHEVLEAAARRFLGFSAILRRQFPDIPVSQNLVLDSDPKLPVKCFSNRELSGATQEVGFFERNAGRRGSFDFEGPWPEREYGAGDFVRSLARHLRDADRRFDGTYRAAADQIQHFICHCEIDEEVTSDSRLLFSAGNVATIADLEARFAVMDERGGAKDGPLVFLNACGTSRIDPMAVSSFPRFFLQENSNRGFIGTETNVPDRFAAEFAQRFYRELLAGLNLGQAIYRARWSMLHERNNPLGILYIVYADPDLHVSKRRRTVN
jgi:hypothetical protein